MLISQLPAHLRAQAEAERERQHPGSKEDRLFFAFSWDDNYDYWAAIDDGNFPPRVYPAEDVEALFKVLDRWKKAEDDYRKGSMTNISKPELEEQILQALATFKSKHPGV